MGKRAGRHAGHGLAHGSFSMLSCVGKARQTAGVTVLLHVGGKTNSTGQMGGPTRERKRERPMGKCLTWARNEKQKKKACWPVACDKPEKKKKMASRPRKQGKGAGDGLRAREEIWLRVGHAAKSRRCHGNEEKRKACGERPSREKGKNRPWAFVAQAGEKQKQTRPSHGGPQAGRRQAVGPAAWAARLRPGPPSWAPKKTQKKHKQKK